MAWLTSECHISRECLVWQKGHDVLDPPPIEACLPRSHDAGFRCLQSTKTQQNPEVFARQLQDGAYFLCLLERQVWSSQWMWCSMYCSRQQLTPWQTITCKRTWRITCGAKSLPVKGFSSQSWLAKHRRTSQPGRTWSFTPSKNVASLWLFVLRSNLRRT